MPPYTFGAHILDADARLLLRSGTAVHLEPKVMDLLLQLVRHRERCVSRDELRASLWPDVSVGQASLARLIKELRKALGGGGETNGLVRTVHGRGYQFVAQDPDGREHRREPALHLSTRLARDLAPLQRAASFGLPAIVEGETGTGKECVARAVHAWSGRSGELCTLRCAAASEITLDAVLARASRPNTTLLLDELGELSPSLQGRLLSRLSDDDATERDSLSRRTVATSQRTLSSLVVRRELRGDLFARLHGIAIVLPPLRERREDIPDLARHFLERSGGANLDAVLHALGKIGGYAWPHNVRELEMFVLRWLALAKDGGCDFALPHLHGACMARSKVSSLRRARRA
jgi:DNA-binding NtrC family response regulator